MFSGAIDIVLTVIFIVLYGSTLDIRLFHNGNPYDDKQDDDIQLVEGTKIDYSEFAKKKILYKF